MSTVDVEIAIQPKGRSRSREPTEPPASTTRIPRIARLMALAIKFQDMVDRGDVRDYADLARLGYVSRARMTQVMNLLNLALRLQENIMLDPKQFEAVSESRIRQITGMVLWKDQLDAWEQVSKGSRRRDSSVSIRGRITGPSAPSEECVRDLSVQKGKATM